MSKITRWIGIVLLIGAVLLVAALFLANRQLVLIDLLWWKPEIPVYLLVPGLLFVGFLAGYVTKAMLATLRRRGREEEEKERRRLAGGDGVDRGAADRSDTPARNKESTP